MARPRKYQTKEEWNKERARRRKEVGYYKSPNHKENVKNYRQRNRTKVLEDSKNRYRGKTYVYHMVKRAQYRAQKKGIPFDITTDDIVIPEVCPVFGTKLIVGEGQGPSDDSPSLDRKIPELGYVKGNVIVISNKANRIKADASVIDIEKVLYFMKTLSN